MTMTPELLLAIIVVAGLSFLAACALTMVGLCILRIPAAERFFGQLFTAIARMVDRGWAAVTRRG